MMHHPQPAPRPTSSEQLQTDGGDEALVAFATEKLQHEMAKFCQSFNKYGDTLQLLYGKFDSDIPILAQKRTCIINNTHLFVKVLLPAAQRFNAELRDVMCNYTGLDFDNFEEALLEIAEAAESCADKAELVRDLHAEDVDETLNMAQAKAELDRELRSMQEQIDAWRASSARQERPKFLTFGFGEYVEQFTLSPAACGSAGNVPRERQQVAMAKMTAAQQQLDNAQDAAEVIAGPLRQCVRSMIDALAAAVQQFNTLNSELQAFKRDAKHLAELHLGGVGEEVLRSRLMQHYNLMKKPARDMEQLCMVFDAAVIATDVKLKRLVAQDSVHESYIKDWLQTKLHNLMTEHEHRRRRAPAQLLSQFNTIIQGRDGDSATVTQPSNSLNSHDGVQASHSTAGAGACKQINTDLRSYPLVDSVAWVDHGHMCDPSDQSYRTHLKNNTQLGNIHHQAQHRAEVAEAGASGMGVGAAQADAAAAAEEPATREELDPINVATHLSLGNMHACEQGLADAEYSVEHAAGAV